jgi:pimeloyl-ACP methyl ester carboxylesterase
MDLFNLKWGYGRCGKTKWGHQMRVFCVGIKFFLTITLFLGALSPLGAGAAEKIGVLLLHSKENGNKSIYHLSGEIESAGYLVEMPSSTPWSPNRIYDRTYLDTLKEMDAAVDKLKAAGATKVVVGGHSIGANVALGYGANRKGIAGLLILGAGHFISGNFMGKKLKDDVAKSKSMIAAGKAKEEADFDDINQRKEISREMTAEIYQSWFDKAGPANMRTNAANLPGDLPVLWVAGKEDKVASKVLKRVAYDKMAGNPMNRFVIISGSHGETAENAGSIVIDWLKTLE